LRTTVYNNTNLTSNAVPKSILELVPSISGLLNRTGHHPTTLNYEPAVVLRAWNLFYEAAAKDVSLWTNPAYELDLVDMTRQVLANAFIPLYQQLVSVYNTDRSALRIPNLRAHGQTLIALLETLDTVLLTNENFRLSSWISAARASAGSQQSLANFLEFEARNQITLWGPSGQISDYASKSWGGLVSSYYVPRWQMFVEFLLATEPAKYNQTAFNAQLLEWELGWQNQTSGGHNDRGDGSHGAAKIKTVLPEVLKQWSDVFTS
jgi:alpha-N-acetylglucosaminidase